MNHIGDIALGFAALVAAAALVLYPDAPAPRPKPEPPPPVEQPCNPNKEECRLGPSVTIRVEPLTKEQAQQQDMNDTKQRLGHVEQQAERIEKKLEALEAVGNGSDRKRN